MGAHIQPPVPYHEFCKHKKYWLQHLYLAPEWFLGCIAAWLSRRYFVNALEYIGKLGLLGALFLWFIPGCHNRKEAELNALKTKNYVAWQTINSAMGKPGNAGRLDALQDLNDDGIHLDGISLAGGVVLVGPMNLTNASLTHADFSDGTYIKVNFSQADLYLSKWNNVTCESCSFQGASFWAAIFNHSTFIWCDFGYPTGDKTKSGALFQTQFSGERTEFRICNFAGAEFPLNIWNSAYFMTCNLAYADLTHVFIQTNDTLFCCNLFGARASPDFIKYASHELTTFTNVVSLSEWNYCVTNRLVVFQRGGPDFVNWASNQYSIYYKTNNPQAWLRWRHENLEN